MKATTNRETEVKTMAQTHRVTYEHSRFGKIEKRFPSLVEANAWVEFLEHDRYATFTGSPVVTPMKGVDGER